MNKHNNLEEVIQSFSAVPYTSIASNEPYAVGDSPEQSNLRVELSEQYIENPNTPWPEFNYPKLDVTELTHSERLLQKVLHELDFVEGTPGEIDVVYEKVAAKLAEVYRHLEVVRGLGRTGVRRELSRERAGEMTLEIFGTPDQAAFDDMLYTDIEAARTPAVDKDSLAATIRTEFLELVGDRAKQYTPENDVPSYELNDETIERLRGDLYALFPKLESIASSVLELVSAENRQSISVQESIPVFARALEAVELDAAGWEAREGEGKAASSNDKTKQIVVGKKRVPFTPVSIHGVPVHEAAHSRRSQNAKEQPIGARQLNLHGNLEFEEGFAMGLEQIVTGEKRIGGIPYYLSLGLQLGMDSDEKKRRSFNEVYQIMWRRSLLDKDIVTDKDVIAAKKKALQQTTRTTRGGSLDARDLSYAEGARKAHAWLNMVAEQDESERRRLLTWVFSGKFDPTNPAHVEIFTDK